MLPNNLCPSCYQIFPNQASASLSAVQVSSSKCSNCQNEIFSAVIRPYSQQSTNEVDNSEVTTYFGGSSSWTTQTKTYQPDPLATKYFQNQLEDVNSLNITDPIKFKEYLSNNPVTNENVEAVINSNDLRQDRTSSWTIQKYQPDPLDMDCFQNHLEDSNSLFITDPIKLEENLSDDSVTDEYVKLVCAVINDYQDINSELDEILHNLLLDFDEIANATASKSAEQHVEKSSESELAQNNSTTTVAETESNLQPQPTDIKECAGSSTHVEKTYPCSEKNENLMKGQKSIIIDEEKPKAKKISRFENKLYPVYTIDTDKRVTKDEIIAKINSNLSNDSLVERDGRFFICHFTANCRIFTNLKGIKNHLFTHLFYFYCATCQLKYCHISSLGNHLKKCKAKNTKSKTESTVTDANTSACIASNSVDFQLKMYDELRSMEPYWGKFSDFEHPIYRKDNGNELSIDEVKAKISENYAIIINGKKRIYVCLLDHDCLRSFSPFQKITYHLFCQFYFYKCSACGKKLGDPGSIRKHLRVCKKKADQLFSKHDYSSSDEWSSNEREFKMSDPVLNSSSCSTDDKELETTSTLVSERIEKCSIVSEHQITIENQPILSSSDNMEKVNERVAVTNNDPSSINEAQTKKRKY